MTTDVSTHVWSDLAIPAGETLEEELDARGIEPADFAAKLGIPLRHLKEIFTGKRRISGDLAWQLDAELGVDARFWMNLQSDHELTLARNRRKAAALPR
jgi:addiction module HigA family antidote